MPDVCSAADKSQDRNCWASSLPCELPAQPGLNQVSLHISFCPLSVLVLCCPAPSLSLSETSSFACPVSPYFDTPILVLIICYCMQIWHTFSILSDLSLPSLDPPDQEPSYHQDQRSAQNFKMLQSISQTQPGSHLDAWMLKALISVPSRHWQNVCSMTRSST